MEELFSVRILLFRVSLLTANECTGDKSNHVATIHLAQMLYIWPLFAFFSLPLLLPAALQLLSGLARLLTGRQPEAQISERKDFQPKSKTAGATKKSSHSLSKQSNTSSALKFTATILSRMNIWGLYVLATVVLSVLIVKFNTIIHPFTLADNRHYMFYVFRYSIRRSQAIRVALVLPYTLSRWLVWGALSGCPEPVSEDGASDCSAHYIKLNSSPFVSHPLWIVKKPDDVRQTDSPYPPALRETSAQSQKTEENPMEDGPLACSVEPVSTSTAIVFLLTTTLSLVTAPLVEPRYFIIPWVIWRLLTPAWRLHDHAGFVSRLRPLGTKGYLGAPLEFFRRYDLRLILETIWFVVINVVTIYIFITRPYQWRAEDGTLLDEGRWQRFMW
jgi:alpha-1,2-glucosyltransferase